MDAVGQSQQDGCAKKETSRFLRKESDNAIRRNRFLCRGGGLRGHLSQRTDRPVEHERRRGCHGGKGRFGLPFRGTLQATETVAGALHRLNGAGEATHLGRFTLTSEFTVTPPPASTASGTATWTAANGDKIFTSTAGQAVITFPVAAIAETHTIIGGTGRFADASGSLVVDRSLNLQTLVSSASLTGTISLGH